MCCFAIRRYPQELIITFDSNVTVSAVSTKSFNCKKVTLLKSVAKQPSNFIPLAEGEIPDGEGQVQEYKHEHGETVMRHLKIIIESGKCGFHYHCPHWHTNKCTVNFAGRLISNCRLSLPRLVDTQTHPPRRRVQIRTFARTLRAHARPHRNAGVLVAFQQLTRPIAALHCKTGYSDFAAVMDVVAGGENADIGVFNN